MAALRPVVDTGDRRAGELSVSVEKLTMNSVEEWSEKAIDYMCASFAACNDAKIIEEVLRKYRVLLLSDAAYQIEAAVRVEGIRNLLNRMSTK